MPDALPLSVPLLAEGDEGRLRVDLVEGTGKALGSLWITASTGRRRPRKRVARWLVELHVGLVRPRDHETVLEQQAYYRERMERRLRSEALEPEAPPQAPPLRLVDPRGPLTPGTLLLPVLCYRPCVRRQPLEARVADLRRARDRATPIPQLGLDEVWTHRSPSRPVHLMPEPLGEGFEGVPRTFDRVRAMAASVREGTGGSLRQMVVRLWPAMLLPPGHAALLGLEEEEAEVERTAASSIARSSATEALVDSVGPAATSFPSPAAPEVDLYRWLTGGKQPGGRVPADERSWDEVVGALEGAVVTGEVTLAERAAAWRKEELVRKGAETMVVPVLDGGHAVAGDEVGRGAGEVAASWMVRWRGEIGPEVWRPAEGAWWVEVDDE